MKNLITTILTAIILIAGSCKNNPATPPEIEPGRRDYVWTVDTINFPFMVSYSSLWGSSPDDLWLAGSGGTNWETLLHYDGKKWGIEKKWEYINFDKYGLYGFSKNNIWMCGQGYDQEKKKVCGEIWHYDGNNWAINYRHYAEGATSFYLHNIWGRSNNDLYAAGSIWFGELIKRGIILHYDGKKWEETYRADFKSYFSRISGRTDRKNNLLITSFKQTPYIQNGQLYFEPDSMEIFEYNDGKMNKVISSQGFYTLYSNVINNVNFIVSKENLYRFSGGKLINEINLEHSEQGYIIFGKNEKDILLSNYEKVYHYNGNDIKDIISINGMLLSAIYFDKTIIIMINNYVNKKSYIYKGKLKE